MGSRTRAAMPAAQRAKQFAPFAAVTGLEEALRRKEAEMGQVDRAELSEEMGDEINRRLSVLDKGMRVSARYYLDGEYVEASGTLKRIDSVSRMIYIDDRKIEIDDILDISNDEGK